MKYRPEIDGLRAVAVLPVILFHAGFGLFSGGYVGVDVFFVISGYLITSIIADDLAEGRFSLLSFYERRARRILPALFFVLACSFVFAGLWLIPDDVIAFMKSVLATLTFSANFLFWREAGYFDTAAELKPLLHTWSLAVEEQYYVLFPVFMIVANRCFQRHIGAVLFAILVLSLALAEWMSRTHPDAAFFLLPTRGWEILLGAMAALYGRHRFVGIFAEKAGNLLGLSGLAMILLAVLLFDDTTPTPSLQTLLPTLGALFLILFATADTSAGRLLQTRPLVGIGLISYSAYLWHQPIFAFTRHRIYTEPSEVLMGTLAALSLVLGWLSWRFVERPFRGRSAVRGSLALGAAASGVVLLLSVSGLSYVKDGDFRNITPQIADIMAMADKARWEDKNACSFSGYRPPAPLRRCIEGFGDEPFVYLIGDSHAMSLSKSVRSKLAAKGYHLLTWHRSGCLPIPGTTRTPASRTAIKRCFKYKEEAFNFIREHPAPVILVARWRLNIEGSRYDNGEGGIESGTSGQVVLAERRDADLIAHIEAELKDLSRSVPVAVLGQVPEAGWDVPRMMAKAISAGIDPNTLSTSYDRYKLANKRVLGLFANLLGDITYIDPAALVCDTGSGRCLNAVDGKPLYRDDDHPIGLLADMIADEIVDTFLPVISKADVAKREGTTE